MSVESNHFHAVVTDTGGTLSQFMHWLDAMTAKNLIAHYAKARPEQYLDAIWSKDHFNAVVLANEAALMNAVAYDLANPVKDGLVRDYRDWPGLNSRPGDWLKPVRRARRPEGLFFSGRNKDARWVDVQYSMPPMLRDRRVEDVVETINALIRDRMKSARKEMSVEGRNFLGVKGLLAVDPFDAPKTHRPKGKRVPIIAAGGDAAALKRGLKLVRTFRESYRDCWTRLTRGVRNVTFPAGTYLMRIRFGVACDTLQPPWCVAT